MCAGFRSSERGFTLIELMMVVLIIGILVTIAVPVFQQMSDAARRRTCQANLRVLDGAIQNYAAEHDGAYPAQLNDLVNPSYVRTLPSCPSGGNYALAGTGGAMQVTCDLPGHSL